MCFTTATSIHHNLQACALSPGAIAWALPACHNCWNLRALEPMLHNKKSHQWGNLHTTAVEAVPAVCNQSKAPTAMKTSTARRQIKNFKEPHSTKPVPRLSVHLPVRSLEFWYMPGRWCLTGLAPNWRWVSAGLSCAQCITRMLRHFHCRGREQVLCVPSRAECTEKPAHGFFRLHFCFALLWLGGVSFCCGCDQS